MREQRAGGDQLSGARRVSKGVGSDVGVWGKKLLAGCGADSRRNTAAHHVEAAGFGRAAVVIHSAGPLGEFAGGDGGLAVEADDVESFAGGAEDQQLLGKTVVDAQHCLIVLLPPVGKSCGHLLLSGYLCSRHGRLEPQS